METIKVAEFITEIEGDLISGRLGAKIDQVAIDSRKINGDELFFAIEGDRFDGHDFVKEAVAAGAKGVVIKESERERYDFSTDVVVIGVADTTQALQDLAAYYRSRFEITVIGVTGSTGKTTTKDLIASVLEEKFTVLKTEGNYNNEFGLPLTLFRLNSNCEVAVLELAMRSLGDIKQLCEIANPQLGVVTNVGLTHLECLGSQANIAAAKSELIDNLSDNGQAILNGDDDYVRPMGQQAGVKSLHYGYQDNNNLQVVQVNNLGASGIEFVVQWLDQTKKFKLPLLGEYNVYNSLAAIGVGLELGLKLTEIEEGLANPKLTAMRGEIKELEKNITLINDAYNANPTSMRSGLKLLADMRDEDGNLIAVVGDMLELGSKAKELHRKIGAVVIEREIDYLITVGDLAALIGQEAKRLGMSSQQVFICQDNEEASRELLQILQPDDTILLKASRGMKLEEIEARLLEE
ncbi:MAG: UDP-N-acetylmuramoyl-tripeptide--D-alanyl-D-alanine ligase [Bacillota bacterium]